MKCTKCGYMLPDDSTFCQYCGTKLDEYTDSSPEIIDSNQVMAQLMATHIVESKKAADANETAALHNLEDPEYGLVPHKPIYTKGVDGEHKYLQCLRTLDGSAVSWNRRGSMGIEEVHGIIDIYEIYLPSGQLYQTLYLNMYSKKNSTQAPVGFQYVSESQHTPAPRKEELDTPAKNKSAPKSKPSRLNLFIIIILVIGLGISLLFNFIQYKKISELESRVAEMERVAENEDNYTELLRLIQTANSSNYREIGYLLNKLPIGYENTNSIASQFYEVKKHITTIENGNYSTQSGNFARSAYESLYEFNSTHHNWNLTDYLNDGIYLKRLIFGRKWTNGTYYFQWHEGGLGHDITTNLPSSKKSWLSYYYTIADGPDDEIIIGYKNSNDSSDSFNAYRILDIIYADEEWSLLIYCYYNDQIYTLK